MTKIFRTFSMDYSSERRYAQRSDGQWFSRYQYRDPRYGYKWSAWKRWPSLPTEAMEIGESKVWLPK